MKIRYNIKDIIKELRPICDELKRMPTEKELYECNKYDLAKSIEKYDIFKIHKLLGV